MSQFAFNPQQQGVTPSTGVQDPIPAGWHKMYIETSEIVPTKDAATTGNAYIMNTFVVLEGPYAGRKVIDNLNIRNSNVTTQQIAYEDLAAIQYAINVIDMQDTNQLCNIPLLVRVKIQPAKGDYEANNQVRGYKNINDNTVEIVTQGPAQAQPPIAPTPPSAVAQPPVAPPVAAPVATPQAPVAQPPAAPPATAPAVKQPWEAWAGPIKTPPVPAATPPVPAQTAEAKPPWMTT